MLSQVLNDNFDDIKDYQLKIKDLNHDLKKLKTLLTIKEKQYDEEHNQMVLNHNTYVGKFLKYKEMKKQLKS